MFGYGFLAVALVLYLDALGLDALTIGVVLSLTLVGDTPALAVAHDSCRPVRPAARPGGRGVLMVIAGAVFAATDWVPVLIIAATIGVISPTGNEVGPFLAIEQAALSQIVPDERRTATFAWYNLVGYVATATGALARGLAQPGPAGSRPGRRSMPIGPSSSAMRSSASPWPWVLAARRRHRGAASGKR